MSMTIDPGALPETPPPEADPGGVPMPAAPPPWNPSVDLGVISRSGASSGVVQPGAYAPAPQQPLVQQGANLEDLSQQAAGIKRQEMADKARITAEEDARLARHRAVMDARFAQTGVNPEDFKTWDQDAAREKYRHDPIQEFGSLGSVFAIIASAFTNRPMEAAMLGSAAAINAAREGKALEYERAYKTWQDNTALAVKRQSAMHQSYADATAMVSTDMALAQQRLQAAATQYGDKQMLAYAEAGLWPKAMELLETREKLNSGIIENEPKLAAARLKQSQLLQIQELPPEQRPAAIREFNNIWAAGKDTVIENILRKAQDEKGSPLTADESISVVEKYEKAKDQRSGVETPLKVVLNKFLLANPEATPEEISTFIRNSKGASDTKNDQENRRIAVAESKAEELVRHNQRMEDLSEGRGGTAQQRADETERHNRAMETITSKRSTGGPQAAEVERRAKEYEEQGFSRSAAYDKAAAEVKAANAVLTIDRNLLPAIEQRTKALEAQGVPPEQAKAQATREVRASSVAPSGNRIDDLKGMQDRVTLAESVIDKIDDMLLQHKAITGIGGTITRPLEVLGNILGSDETDRVQFARYVAELKELLPRIITGSNARPLAAEMANINRIAAGMSPGDTGANTMRAYAELRPVLQDIKQRLKDRGTGLPTTGGPAATPAPAADKDAPWFTDPSAKR